MKRIAYFITGIALGVLFSLSHRTDAAPGMTIQSAPDSLSEWQVLQMDIAMTESKFNPDAVGSSQDYGILQITPIYAREASRLNKDRDYAHEEAFDTRTALEMFDVVQTGHNPERDIDKAIRLHNRAGWYSDRVRSNITFIKRMETARQIIRDYDKQ